VPFVFLLLSFIHYTLGLGGDFFLAELSTGLNTSIIEAAVKAAYFPAFLNASLRVIFSSFMSFEVLVFFSIS
jgi:hypothetical protein